MKVNTAFHQVLQELWVLESKMSEVQYEDADACDDVRRSRANTGLALPASICWQASWRCWFPAGPGAFPPRHNCCQWVPQLDWSSTVTWPEPHLSSATTWSPPCYVALMQDCSIFKKTYNRKLRQTISLQSRMLLYHLMEYFNSRYICRIFKTLFSI